jgi:glycosyltransferase involved in cell wall biosynthesis
MRKTRLLILIPNLGTGGAQKVYRQQLTLLSNTFDVYGCVFNRDGFLPQDHMANIYSLDVAGGSDIISKIVFFFKRVIRLKRLKQQLSIDVCISHLEGADYINLLSRKKEKVICWIHGTKTFDQNISGGVGWIRKKFLIPATYRRFDFIVAVNTRISAELVIEYGVNKSKVRTIYNGFELQAIKAGSSNPVDIDIFDKSNSPVIITHCRLAKEKNLSTLLELFKSVRVSNPSKLVILGDGELRDELVRKSKSLNLLTFDVWASGDLSRTSYDVYFLGYQANPYQYLSKASLYVMTSLWEGFPLALCEAMACGLPVVSTDCYTGPREILDPSNSTPIPTREILRGEFGVLLPMISLNDELQLDRCSKELHNLLSDKKLHDFYAERALQRVSAFDADNIYQDVFAVIRRTAGILKKD